MQSIGKHCTHIYLLPGVKFQGGDADIFDLFFRGSKQQEPMGSGWQRYLKKKASYLSKLLLLDKDILMCQCGTINRKKVSDLHYFLSPAVLGQQGICKRRQSSQLETSQTHLSSGYRSCSSYGDKRTNKNIASSPHKTLNPSFNITPIDYNPVLQVNNMQHFSTVQAPNQGSNFLNFL